VFSRPVGVRNRKKVVREQIQTALLQLSRASMTDRSYDTWDAQQDSASTTRHDYLPDHFNLQSLMHP
jgi:hypothetical protein